MTPEDPAIDALLELVSEIHSNKDPIQVLARLLDRIVELSGGERAYVATPAREGGFEVRIGRERGKPIPIALATLSQTLIRDGITSQGSFFVGDALGSVRYSKSESIRKVRIHSALVVPLFSDKTAFGALVVEDRSKPDAFDETRRRRVEHMAALVTHVIDAIANRETEDSPDSEPVKTPAQAALEGLVGTSEAMLEVQRLILKFANAKEPVLITGESGTGKELVARAVHRLSPRFEEKFVAANCAALPSSIIERELFGHEKGAFSGATEAAPGYFEIADGGSLFLDEIGDFDIDLQPKLLRVLQEKTFRRLGGRAVRKVDVRLISATNRDLPADVKSGRFREDLWYRIAVLRIKLPALRERGGDVAVLIDHFLHRIAKDRNEPRPRRLTQQAKVALLGYQWPGNVRQLEGVLRAAHILTDGPITPDVLDLSGPSTSAASPTLSMEEVQKAATLAAIERAGSIPEAAALLKCDKVTLYRRLRAWDLSHLIGRRGGRRRKR